MRASVLKPVPCLLLVAAALGLFANRAAASCGDYVMIGGHHSGHERGHSAPAVTENMPGSADGEAPGGPHVPCPCRGAECSQLPISWPVPAPVRVNIERDNLLAASGVQPGDHDCRQALCLEPSHRMPAFSVADIFRPPQMVCLSG